MTATDLHQRHRDAAQAEQLMLIAGCLTPTTLVQVIQDMAGQKQSTPAYQEVHDCVVRNLRKQLECIVGPEAAEELLAAEIAGR